jgi:hypothetical protein
LIESRVGTTRAVVEWLGRLQRTPRVLVSASAVGWYGTDEQRLLTEADAAGSGFASPCARRGSVRLGERSRAVCASRVLRIGRVLGAGGLLARLLPAYRLGLGARLGSGRQWLPWVHLEDLLCMIEAALSDEHWHGAVNAVAPACARNRDFSAALARVVGRPLLFAVPAWALRSALGEMSTLLLDGQQVAARGLAELGYRFRFVTLEQALARSLQDRARTAGRPVIEHA